MRRPTRRCLLAIALTSAILAASLAACSGEPATSPAKQGTVVPVATRPPDPTPEPSVTSTPAATATANAVVGWTGTVVKFGTLAQYGDYFQRSDGERYGVQGATDQLEAQIVDARCRRGTVIRVWGHLEVDIPDSYGRRITVERLEVVSTPPAPAPEQGQGETQVDGWLGRVVPLCRWDRLDNYFERDDGVSFGIDAEATAVKNKLYIAEGEGYLVRVWGVLHRGVDDYRNARIVVERLEVAGFAPTPTATPTPAAPVITPVLTGAEIAVGGWSPDGEWLAFWKADDSAPAQLHRAMTLSFYNARSGQTCDCPEIRTKTTDVSPPPLTWQDDGQVLVRDGATTWRGAPCQGSFQTVNDVQPQAGALSPGGSYRAATREEESGDTQIKGTTTLSDARSGQTVQTVEYVLPAEAEGYLGLGGAWVTDSVFLIRETLDRGPLLVDVKGGRVVAVMAELFSLEELPSPNLGFWAAGQAVAGSDSYHIVLGGVHHGLFGGAGLESTYPPLQLYHSETGQVEELPFRIAWSPTFSPDGRWLLVDARPWRTRVGTDETYPSGALWARPVDPAGSAAHLAADGESLACWSPDWTRVAMAGPGSSFGLPNVTSVYSFPEGTVLNAWATGDYRARPGAWSPDGKRLAMAGLAMSGNVPGGLQYALFVVEP